MMRGRTAEKKTQSQMDVFTSLYNDSFDYVYGFVYARMGTAGETEEILQETYAAAWARMGSFKNLSSSKTWLVSIARRKIADHYRRVIRRERHEEQAVEPSGNQSGMDLESVIINHETREHVSKALAALSPIHRYALAMKYLDGCSVKDIASILRRTPKAVDGILQRAKASFIKNYHAVTGGGQRDGR